MHFMSYVVRCFDATGDLRHERNPCGKTENKQVLTRRSDERKGQQMNADTQTPIEKIRKVSRIVRTVCKILMGFTIIGFLVAVVLIGVGPKIGTLSLGEGADIPVSHLTTAARVLALMFFSLGTVVALKGVYHLYKLFGNYADGNVFTAESVAQIKQLGVTFLLVAGLQVLAVPVRFLLASSCGLKTVVFSLGGGCCSGPLGSLITAGLLILISWVMETGRGLREENELTI